MNSILIVNTVTAIAEACRLKLAEALGGDLPIKLGPVQPRREHDYDLTIGTRPATRLAVEVKTRVATRNQALHLIFRLRHALAANLQPAVFADWIAEPAAEEFRKAQTFFVDTQGNIFLRRPPHLVIDIRGKRPERPLKAEPGRLIEPGGLKVIHYLLTHPEDTGAPLRAIAQNAGVALGTAHAVRAELRRAQWLLPAAEGKGRFGDLKGLLDLFVRGYALKLRPACVIGRYRHKKNLPEDIVAGFAQRLTGLEAKWAVTGGLAARELTHYPEPNTVAVFVDDPARAKLGEEPMLRDDTAGNVTLLRLPEPGFIAKERTAPWPLATPFLVYAELLQEGEQRELETAEMIYERFIAPRVKHGR